MLAVTEGKYFNYNSFKPPALSWGKMKGSSQQNVLDFSMSVTDASQLLKFQKE